MAAVKWYLAVTGVRRSNIRSCESLDTDEMRAGFEGQNAALYVQVPTGSVVIEFVLVGDHYSDVSNEVREGGGGGGGLVPFAVGTHNLDGPIPRAGHKIILCDWIPGYRKRLPLVLVKIHNGKRLRYPNIEKLDGAISARRH